MSTTNLTTESTTTAQAAETEAVETKSASKAAEALDETTDESEALEAEDGDDKQEELGEKPKKSGGVQKRFNKITKEKHDIARERDFWKAEALKSKGEPAKTSDVVAAKPQGEPKADDFETPSAYYKALAKWTFDENDKQAKAEAKQNEQVLESKKLAEAYSSHVEEFKKTHDDYDDVIESVDDIEAPKGLTNAILRSKNPAALAYELATNRDEFERICALDSAGYLFELGAISARLAKPSEVTQEKKTTKAPPPISPLGAKNAGMKKSISDPELPFAEYVKLRREQQRKRA